MGRNRLVLFAVFLLLTFCSCAQEELNFVFLDEDRIPDGSLYPGMEVSMELRLKFGRQVETSLFYPSGTEPFSTVFVGYQEPLDPRQEVSLTDEFIGAGIALLFVKFNTQTNEEDFSDDILMCIEEMVAEGAFDGSPIFSRVRTPFGLLAHGTAAVEMLRAFQKIHRLDTGGLDFDGTAAALVSPILSEPNQFTPLLSSSRAAVSRSPVLVVSASEDCIHPPNSHARSCYGSIPQPMCRTYVELRGGNSCLFPLNQPTSLPLVPNCMVEEELCGSTVSSLSSEQHHAFLNALLVGFFNATLPSGLRWAAFHQQLAELNTNKTAEVFLDCIRDGQVWTVNR